MAIRIDAILFGVIFYCTCWVNVLSHVNQGYPPGVPPPTGAPQQGQYQHHHASNQQFQQPPAGNQQFQQPPAGNQQFQQQPQGNQQFQQPPAGNQQFQQPPAGNQQFQQPPAGNQQFQQPPAGNQQFQQQPQGNQQFQQQPQGNQQFQQQIPGTQQFQQQPPQGGSHGHAPGHGHAHNLENEREHIAEHLKDYSNKPVDQMTEEEIEFHYFKLHDYDDNNKLDGNEITSAITHFQREDNAETNAPARSMTNDEITDIVDMVLKEDDLNNDGYIEYSEFATAQRRSRASAPKNEVHK
ncbi:nuclear transcription factor Y subunit beta isoform X1 [Argonauta hians]